MRTLNFIFFVILNIAWTPKLLAQNIDYVRSLGGDVTLTSAEKTKLVNALKSVWPTVAVAKLDSAGCRKLWEERVEGQPPANNAFGANIWCMACKEITIPAKTYTDLVAKGINPRITGRSGDDVVSYVCADEVKLDDAQKIVYATFVSAVCPGVAWSNFVSFTARREGPDVKFDCMRIYNDTAANVVTLLQTNPELVRRVLP